MIDSPTALAVQGLKVSLLLVNTITAVIYLLLSNDLLGHLVAFLPLFSQFGKTAKRDFSVNDYKQSVAAIIPNQARKINYFIKHHFTVKLLLKKSIVLDKGLTTFDHFMSPI